MSRVSTNSRATYRMLPGAMRSVRACLLPAALSLLSLTLSACAPISTGAPLADTPQEHRAAPPSASASVVHDTEGRIHSMVEDWFRLFEGVSRKDRSFDDFISQSSFEFMSDEVGKGMAMSVEDYSAWAALQQASYLQIEHELGELRIDPQADDMYRVRFEFDRFMSDRDGTPHVARRMHSWLVHDVPGQAPEVLRINEQRKLYFPGTGPQIVCY